MRRATRPVVEGFEGRATSTSRGTSRTEALALNTYPLRIVPSASMTRLIKQPGTLVVVQSGAFMGYRIHWVQPTSGVDVNATQSELLINGECYAPPDGSFKQFWITTEAAVSFPPENLELRVINIADVQPVQLLNPRVFGGYKSQRLGGGTVATLTVATGTQVLYTDAARPATGELQATDKVCYQTRGYIGGGVSAATPFRLYLIAGLTTNVTSTQCEICRWVVDTADIQGRYSCSFDFGARSVNGPTVNLGGVGPIPYPPYGLRLILGTDGAVDVTDATWLLLSRTEGQ